jgi:hypothetical protein
MTVNPEIQRLLDLYENINRLQADIYEKEARLRELDICPHCNINSIDPQLGECQPCFFDLRPAPTD